jgi:hypothetical protein
VCCVCRVCCVCCVCVDDEVFKDPAPLPASGAPLSTPQRQLRYKTAPPDPTCKSPRGSFVIRAAREDDVQYTDPVGPHPRIKKGGPVHCERDPRSPAGDPSRTGPPSEGLAPALALNK